MTPADDTAGLLCYCRAGFEPELAAELTERAAAQGIAGYVRAHRGAGYVLFFSEAACLDQGLAWRDLIFARQRLQLIAELRDLNPNDRISPILTQLSSGPTFGELRMEYPDSEHGRILAGLARSLGNALRPRLRRQRLLSATVESDAPRLHVCLLESTHLLLAYAEPSRHATWPQSVLRLKMTRDAPSRSALKLEEALAVLMSAGERTRLLRAGMQAADLGAAPGGWTWVLTRHHLHVTAVDNGALRANVLDTGLVNHLRADGFRWQPARPLDWVVCDMVEQPRRVAARMAEWFRHGWCRSAIFNLKLPMKKRWQETRYCLEQFEQLSGGSALVRARQLYHDREEITIFASRG